jgi:hypothetical protein
MPIHARIKAVKDSLTEQGQTVNEELLLECADQVGGELESEFLYMISDLPNFDLQTIQDANPTDANKSNLDWFIKLNNELTELSFWMKTNPTTENKARVDTFKSTRIKRVIEQRFENHRARTR